MDFDPTDLTNYQHPPCMFLLWYIFLLVNAVMDFIANMPEKEDSGGDEDKGKEKVGAPAEEPAEGQANAAPAEGEEGEEGGAPADGDAPQDEEAPADDAPTDGGGEEPPAEKADED